MRIENAVNKAVKVFPFSGYMTFNGKPKESYFNIAKTVVRHLKKGGRVLDFGCGPGDKTLVLQLLGYKCYGYDDLNDDWHKISGNKKRIVSFAKAHGIKFKLAKNSKMPFSKNYFDMIMLHDVLEHSHNSPRKLLNDLITLLKPEGFIFITVPNAVNIRKRIDVLFGKTNMPRFEIFYWYPGEWRGHIREYVKNDLIKLLEYLDLEKIELRNCDHMLSKLPPFLKSLYLLVTKVFPGFKDSWLLVARKGINWKAKNKISKEKLNNILNVDAAYIYK